MTNIQQATHSHKRAGAVVVLQSTAELAKVRVITSGDEFWVKLADLTKSTGVAEGKPRKKSKAHDPRPALHSAALAV
jgi:hypothetical protein